MPARSKHHVCCWWYSWLTNWKVQLKPYVLSLIIWSWTTFQARTSDGCWNNDPFQTSWSENGRAKSKGLSINIMNSDYVDTWNRIYLGTTNESNFFWWNGIRSWSKTRCHKQRQSQTSRAQNIIVSKNALSWLRADNKPTEPHVSFTILYLQNPTVSFDPGMEWWKEVIFSLGENQVSVAKNGGKRQKWQWTTERAKTKSGILHKNRRCSWHNKWYRIDRES